MKHYVKIRINTTKKSDILLKLNRINVDIRNVIYHKDYLVMDILYDDIKRVKKYLISYKLEIVDETGIYKVKSSLKKNMLFIVSIIFGIIVFMILSNVIVKVNVIHESRELREIITDALKDRGVMPLTFKKSYQEYENIITEIKNSYKDKLEWLEIDVDGMVINVRVEERIINNYDKETGYCHIVAAKSGIVKYVYTQRGVQEVQINDYVNKDDILISGEIKLYDEVKNNVCASGEVKGEVWYNVKTSFPLNYEEVNKTGKMRYNFMVKTNAQEYVVLKSRVLDKVVENVLLFKIFGMEFYIQKEYEVEKNKKKYTEDEALKKAINIVHEKFVVKGAKIEDIINEKVLKKNINNDNLDIEMFVAIIEQIGIKKNYELEMDSGTNDKDNNGGNNGVN
ncbi:MAG: sporulation protein YqfD [Bacilli bacterium]|jgi:similar to stage IV sporulation protein|nr:sporulation protein YqfD [Bacilli bacterium]MCX4255038.1 sporulation protein YqfD [Bacilli bacterium]